MIYLDYAATTPLDNEVKKTYFSLLDKYFYNNDSIYDKGIEVNNLMEQSRDIVAKYLNVSSEELIFTSCGSEANNMAIKGTCFKYKNRGKHIITSSVEHSSVYESFKELESVFGFEVTYLPVNNSGQVSLEDLKNAIREDTILVSIMYVNNELGSINDINSIARYLKDYSKIIFHVDMVQALGKIDIELTNIDLASFSAHKICGLKGSGLLYKAKKISLVPLISGGQQEFGLRGGTSNACTNIVFAKTLRLMLDNFEEKIKYVKELNAYTKSLLSTLDNVVINSDENCLANIINFSCVNYKPEVILHALEQEEIYISTRSACSSKTSDVSRVMAMLNIDEKIAKSALRISVSYLTSYEDIDKFVYCLKSVLLNTRQVR